jgi:hypothetical protein
MCTVVHGCGDAVRHPRLLESKEIYRENRER